MSEPHGPDEERSAHPGTGASGEFRDPVPPDHIAFDADLTHPVHLDRSPSSGPDRNAVLAGILIGLVAVAALLVVLLLVLPGDDDEVTTSGGDPADGSGTTLPTETTPLDTSDPGQTTTSAETTTTAETTTSTTSSTTTSTTVDPSSELDGLVPDEVIDFVAAAGIDAELVRDTLEELDAECFDPASGDARCVATATVDEAGSFRWTAPAGFAAATFGPDGAYPCATSWTSTSITACTELAPADGSRWTTHFAVLDEHPDPTSAAGWAATLVHRVGDGPRFAGSDERLVDGRLDGVRWFRLATPTNDPRVVIEPFAPGDDGAVVEGPTDIGVVAQVIDDVLMFHFPDTEIATRLLIETEAGSEPPGISAAIPGPDAFARD